jgi:Ala-tRNA(Pro) deacylase
MTSVFDRVEAKLREAGVPFEVLRHAPVFTSEEAAAVRGSPLASGAKAIVMKVGEQFALLILPADRKVDSRKVRAAFGVKSVRFADRAELERLTGLEPGSVPPFGSLFSLPTWCDPALGENASINFNAGDHTISVKMSYTDFVAVEMPATANLT